MVLAGRPHPYSLAIKMNQAFPPKCVFHAQCRMHQKDCQYRKECAVFESAWERHRYALAKAEEAELALLGGPRSTRAPGSVAEKDMHWIQQRVRQVSRQEQQWKRAHTARTKQLLETMRNSGAASLTARSSTPPAVSFPQRRDLTAQTLHIQPEQLARARYHTLQLQQEAILSATAMKHTRERQVHNATKQAHLIEADKLSTRRIFVHNPLRTSLQQTLKAAAACRIAADSTAR